jgi:hypothetical protein
MHLPCSVIHSNDQRWRPPDWKPCLVTCLFTHPPHSAAALNPPLRCWPAAHRRRSQRHRLPWNCFAQLAARCLRKPTILHPLPNERFVAKHRKSEPDAVTLHVRSRARDRQKERSLPRPGLRWVRRCWFLLPVFSDQFAVFCREKGLVSHEAGGKWAFFDVGHVIDGVRCQKKQEFTRMARGGGRNPADLCVS